MNDRANIILAFALSAVVLVGWQYLVRPPQIASHNNSATRQVQTHLSPKPASHPPQERGPVPPVRFAEEENQPESRSTALDRSPRVEIETPTLHGSIALKGARIDDLSLACSPSPNR